MHMFSYKLWWKRISFPVVSIKQATSSERLTQKITRRHLTHSNQILAENKSKYIQNETPSLKDFTWMNRLQKLFL